MYDVKRRYKEEWPSEIYNYQDHLALKPTKKLDVKPADFKNAPHPTTDETSESAMAETKISKEELSDFLSSVDGIGKKKVKNIINHFGSADEVVGVLHQNSSILTEVTGITKKLVAKIEKAWKQLLK